MEEKQRTKTLGSILLTAFIDLLGIGIITPVAAPLLLNSGSTFLDPSWTSSERNLILGVLMALFPLAQFFGSPLLGALADKHGRRKILILSLAGSAFGYVLFAIGIYYNSLTLLFLSRLIDGLTGGNISVVFSAISDITAPKDRAKTFGLVGAAFGIGFLVGPFLGGVLANSNYVSWFNYATPYWFTATLCIINLVAVVLYLPETLKEPTIRKITWTAGFENISKAFSSPNLRRLFTVVFLQTLGFAFFTQFFQVFMIYKFDATIEQVSRTFAYVGLWVVITQAGLIRLLPKKYNSSAILKVSLLVMAISVGLVVIPSKAWIIYMIIPFIAMGQGFTAPNLSSMVSLQANSHEQGQIFGINQSLQAMGLALPPLISGMLTNIDIRLPILTACALIFFSWTLFLQGIRKKKINIHQPSH